MQYNNNNFSNININELLSDTVNTDNLYAFAMWATVGLIIFAAVYLFFAVKKAKRGEKPASGMAVFIKWALLFASAGFNVFFTYYVFLPVGPGIAFAMAFVMGGVNLAEAYLVRLTLAAWRHNLGFVYRIALFLIVPLFAYSLMAAGSSFTTMMNKNKDSLKASQLELSASSDKLNAVQAKLKEVQAGEKGGLMLANLQMATVRNSRGTRVSFGRIKQSCDSGGYYARNYPDLCGQYNGLRNGSYKAGDVARAEQVASLASSNEKLKMAQILKDRPPEIMPTLLGFSLGFAFVGFVVSLALESAIVGIGFFEELFIKPTVLPANISFKDKKLDWNEKDIQQKGLKIDRTPSPHVSFNPNQTTNPYTADSTANNTGGQVGKFEGHDLKGGQGNPKEGQGQNGYTARGHDGVNHKGGRGQVGKSGGHDGVRTETPDTGIEGINSTRYQAVKKAIKAGELKPTRKALKTFKFGGVGMGDKTAEKYLTALRVGA